MMKPKLTNNVLCRRQMKSGPFTVAARSLIALAMLSPSTANAQSACNDALLPPPAGCKRTNSDIVVGMPAGENTERAQATFGGEFAKAGFAISIDGQTVAGAPAPAIADRQADIAADQARITLKYDGLDRRRILNVSTADLRAAFRAGDRVVFRTSSNYPQYVSRAEIRIIDLGTRGRPTVAVLPAAANGRTEWSMPAEGSGDFAYVLRVYDGAGRYDETVPLNLGRTGRDFDTHTTTGPVIAAGEGEDRTKVRNIPLRGGLVTVAGRDVRAGADVRVLGEPVPVDASGAFVVSRILPAGDHVVAIDVDGRTYLRDVRIPAAEWFYVGIGNLTFGKRFRDDLVSADPDYKKTWVDGRIAGYIDGKTQGGYRITASVDSGEGPIENVFSRLNDKDPRRVIQRLEDDDFFPTYGDDSASFDNAPTSGRFYLRVEKDASSLTWGDFKADIAGSEFLRNSRGLYGAELRYVSPSVTADGAPRAGVTAYAAQTETLPQRDILRGTGGSVYFLSHQDISGGTETIVVETADPATGRVISRRPLVEGVDYTIDYIQGVVLLTTPLGPTAPGGGVVGGGSGANDVNLVAQYEYTPTTSSLEGAALGGRAEFWASDRLRFGATGMKENAGPADQRMFGADVRHTIGENSHLEAEIAQTEGPGFGRSMSTDGGLTNSGSGAAVAPRARAYRLEGHFDFADLGWGLPGFAGIYYERKEAGFSTVTEDITGTQTLIGLNAEAELTERLSVGMDLETFDKTAGDHRKTGEVRLTYALGDMWTVTGGLKHTDLDTAGNPSETGERTDLGLRAEYRPHEDLMVYGFGQLSVHEAGGLGENDRIGLGAEARVTEKMQVRGEVSDGDKGVAADIQLSYAPTADNEYYLGYALDPTRTGAGSGLVGRDDGTFVVGARTRQSEEFSSYAENTWDMFGARQSLTRTYGVSYTPDARWTVSGGVEAGTVRDKANGDFNLEAYSLGFAYTSDAGTSARARLEYRAEDGAGLAQDRTTWVASAGYERRVSDDWRLLADVDALFSESDQTAFRDGEYVEANLGYAYRPVAHDRLNLLLRYTHLRDLPGPDQVTADGTTGGPLQKSHVFAVDGNYQLSPKLTVGTKYAFRQSSVAPRGSNAFSRSTAHLGIARLDWHVVHKWDVSGEARLLYTQQTDIRETGAVFGVYRHVGNNAKVGLSYEWGKVSDNPTDLDYISRGVFIDLVAKF